MSLTENSNSLSRAVRQAVKTIRSKCRGVDDRALRQALEKEIKLAVPLRRGPRIAPDVAQALRLREKGKPWKEIYAAVVDPKLARPLRQALCAQLRHKVKLHLRRRRLRAEKQRRGRKEGVQIQRSGENATCGADRVASVCNSTGHTIKLLEHLHKTN